MSLENIGSPIIINLEAQFNYNRTDNATIFPSTVINVLIFLLFKTLQYKKERENMTIRCLFFGKYTPESVKGILNGSDRSAAVKAVLEAAGGTLNFMSFTRGPWDVVVDMNMPSTEAMLGAMVTVHASGSMSDAMHLECVDGDPIWEAARSISANYTPADA